MPIQLRPYQLALVEKTRNSFRAGKRSPLIVSPCGSGKTVAFSYFAESASSKGKNVLILAHREELIDQISETLKQFDVSHSFICAGRDFDKSHKVHVGSVFSVVRRLDKIKTPDVVIIDECHHAIKGSTWGRVLDRFPKAFRVGVTASPARLSGEPLGDVFDDMILGPSVSDLISMGSLCKYKLFAPSTIDTSGVRSKFGDFVKKDLSGAVCKPVITGHAIAEYKKRAPGKRAIVFCVSVEHAKSVAMQFNESGFRAASLDGTMDSTIRKMIVSDYRSGKIDVLTSCDIVSEGFDLPAIEVAIMLRPTQSLALWIQQSGRALRPFAGKDHAIILDHAGNAMRHGLPDDDREWSLKGKVAGISKNKQENPVKTCPKCFCVYPGALNECPECHFVSFKPREVETIEGELVEVDVQRLRKERINEQLKANTEEELYQIGLKRGYKGARRWAKYVFQARQAKKLARGRP